MNPFYLIVAERAEHVCEYCQAPEAVFNFLFEVDHVVRLRKAAQETWKILHYPAGLVTLIRRRSKLVRAGAKKLHASLIRASMFGVNISA